MDSLRSYNNEDIILELPGDTTVFNIDWLSVFDVKIMVLSLYPTDLMYRRR